MTTDEAVRVLYGILRMVPTPDQRQGHEAIQALVAEIAAGEVLRSREAAGDCYLCKGPCRLDTEELARHMGGGPL